MTPPHDITAAVRAELAVPGRYNLHPAGVVARSSWWQLVAQWLGDRWNAIVHFWFSHLHIRAADQHIAGDAVVVLCIVVIAVVAARLLIALQVARERRTDAHPLDAIHRSAHALALQAARAAEAHDYARAVRLLFAAAITLLDLRGVVHDEESATINELRRALRERNANAERPFVELARIYTSAAYAERPVDFGSWERARGAYDALAAREPQ